MSLNSYLSEKEKNKQIYILRYYLPCEPIYDKDTTERRCDELIEYCRVNRIQAVMLYVDLHPYWYYMPDSLEHTKYYVGVVNSLADRLRKIGVSYQLNYQNLFGSWDGGADMRYVNGWENYVDQYGNESWGVGCSIGEKFREIAGEKLRLWAQTQPDIIWIDDDIRFHNHRTAMHKVYSGDLDTEELDFGCFCDNHINEFNRTYGLSVTREQLHQGIISGGDLRRKWLDFCRICANEVAQWIEKTVNEMSENTTVALMSSVPDTHSVEGRHWGEFLRNLSGDKTPVVRAHFGPYCESNPQEFFLCYNLIEQLKSNIKSQFDGEFEFCPELENTRFSVWSKSLAATRYQLMLSAFLGCRGITLSIYDLEGGLLSEYSEFAHLLQKVRPFCDEMANEKLWHADTMGIALITAPDRVGQHSFKKNASKMQELKSGRKWDDILLRCAVPCKYVTPDEICQNSIFAIDKFTAEQLTDEEITEILSKAVVLDAGAAKCFQDRGYGKYLGVKISEKLACIASTEVYDHYCHCDGSKMRLPIRINGGNWNEIFLTGATCKSRYVTPHGKEYPATAVFENDFGGKVIVFAGNSDLGDGFFSTYRVKWLKSLLNEFSEGTLPQIDNKSYALFVAKELNDKDMFFIANMSADELNDLTISLPREYSRGYIIDTYGVRRDIYIEDHTAKLRELKLGMYSAVVCVLCK